MLKKANAFWVILKHARARNLDLRLSVAVAKRHFEGSEFEKL
jgi:hypothetical protein